MPSHTRDLRVDFFRGVALLVMCWDHVLMYARGARPLLTQFTPTFWGFSDAAEWFIFLSGFVFGLVYARTYARGGAAALWAKTGNRMWQLYAVNLITFAVAFGLLAGATVVGDPLRHIHQGMAWVLASPLEAVYAVVTLRFTHAFMGILPLYIVLLAFGAATLVGMRRHPRLTLGLCVTLYLAVQLWPAITLPDLSGVRRDTWAFNPFAYQLLFALGMFLALRPVRMPRAPAWLWAALLVLALVAVRVWLLPRVATRIELELPAWLAAVRAPLTGKPNMEILRLLHFLVGVFVVARLTRADHPFWSGRLARPIVRTGQASLEVFAFSVVLMHVAAYPVSLWGNGPVVVVGCMIVACALLPPFALLVRARKQQLWDAPRSAPEARSVAA